MGAAYDTVHGDTSYLICMLGQVHAAIRADPAPEKKERQEKPAEKKKWKTSKLTYEERKANLKVHICDSLQYLLLCLHLDATT